MEGRCVAQHGCGMAVNGNEMRGDGGAWHSTARRRRGMA